jgi:hypothetical protein
MWLNSAAYACPRLTIVTTEMGSKRVASNVVSTGASRSGARLSQSKGGKPRPKTHSGTRIPKSVWENSVAVLHDELTRTRDKLQLAVGKRAMKEEDVVPSEQIVGQRVKRPAHILPSVKIEQVLPAAHSSQLDDEIRGLRQALHASEVREADVRRDLETCRSELDTTTESVNGLAVKNAWLNSRVQQLSMDLEWAVALKKDKLPPPTVLRQKVAPKLSSSDTGEDVD